jgi:hypothetical protein
LGLDAGDKAKGQQHGCKQGRAAKKYTVGHGQKNVSRQGIVKPVNYRRVFRVSDFVL